MVVKKGTTFNLRCLVNTGEGSSSMAVFWYLNDKVLDWAGQTGPGEGASVAETRGAQVEGPGGGSGVESVLTIDRARMSHSGQFTCGPTLGRADTVTVHVIDGIVLGKSTTCLEIRR